MNSKEEYIKCYNAINRDLNSIISTENEDERKEIAFNLAKNFDKLLLIEKNNKGEIICVNENILSQIPQVKKHNSAYLFKAVLYLAFIILFLFITTIVEYRIIKDICCIISGFSMGKFVISIIKFINPRLWNPDVNENIGNTTPPEDIAPNEIDNTQKLIFLPENIIPQINLYQYNNLWHIVISAEIDDKNVEFFHKTYEDKLIAQKERDALKNHFSL